MSTGSVGDSESVLSPDVYVSDDGGYSWLLALKGPHHYAILDSGGLLVAVEHANVPVNQIKSANLGIGDSCCFVFRAPSGSNCLIALSFKIFHRRGPVLAHV